MFITYHWLTLCYYVVIASTSLHAYPYPDDPAIPCTQTQPCNQQSPNSAAITSSSEASVHFGNDSIDALSSAATEPKPHYATEDGKMSLENESKGSIDLPAKCTEPCKPGKESCADEKPGEEVKTKEKSEKPKSGHKAKKPCKKKSEGEEEPSKEKPEEKKDQPKEEKDEPKEEKDEPAKENDDPKTTESPATETTKTTTTTVATTEVPTTTTTTPPTSTTEQPANDHEETPTESDNNKGENVEHEGMNHVENEAITIPLGPHVQIHLRPGAPQQVPTSLEEEQNEEEVLSPGDKEEKFYDHHNDHHHGTNHHLDITVHHTADHAHLPFDHHDYYGYHDNDHPYYYNIPPSYDTQQHSLEYRDKQQSDDIQQQSEDTNKPLDPHEQHQEIHDTDTHTDLHDHGPHFDEHVPHDTHPDPHNPHDHLDVHNPVDHFDYRDPHHHMAPMPEHPADQQPSHDLVHHTSVYYPHDYPPVHHHESDGYYHYHPETTYDHHPEEGFHHPEETHYHSLSENTGYNHHPEDGHLHYPGEYHLYPPGATHPHHPDDGHSHGVSYNHSDAYSHFQNNDNHTDVFDHQDDVAQSHKIPAEDPNARIDTQDGNPYYHAPDGHYHADSYSPYYGNYQQQNPCIGCNGYEHYYDPNCVNCYDYHQQSPPAASSQSPPPQKPVVDLPPTDSKPPEAVVDPHLHDDHDHIHEDEHHNHGGGHEGSSEYHGGGGEGGSDYHGGGHEVESGGDVHYHMHNYAGSNRQGQQPIIALNPGCCPTILPTTKPPATHHPPSPTPPPKFDWGYIETESVYGPANWHRLAPLCKGTRQSPIDLSASTAVPRPLDGGGIELIGLEFIMRGKLSNNGKTIGFTIDNTVDNNEGNDNEIVKLQSQGNSYILKQFHIHFSCEGAGSEHSIDGAKAVGELHFVFQNENYPIQADALKEPDGLTILAFLLKGTPDAEPNSVFDRISNNILNVQNPSDTLPMPAGISLTKFVPMLNEDVKTLRRFLYKGSLPTPPCYESVTWIVFFRQIPVDETWLVNLRAAKSSNGKICGNSRPVQPLSGREVLKFVPE